MLRIPGPERTRSQLTSSVILLQITSNSACSSLRGQSQRVPLRRQTDGVGIRPNKAGHAKPRSGGNDGAISFGVF